MKQLTFLFLAALFVFGCKPKEQPATNTEAPKTDDFVWQTETFADKKMIRYQVPGFEKLSLNQKKLVYYLVQAGLAGRDIIYDQNYRYNLPIRQALDRIVANYQGDKNSNDWKELLLYAKQVWFSNGIHHHYSHDKFTPGFSREWFEKTLAEVGGALSAEAMSAIFDPKKDPKRVDQRAGVDNVLASAVNFYGPDVTTNWNGA
jgi:dipeptidyl-peptidase-3